MNTVFILVLEDEPAHISILKSVLKSSFPGIRFSIAMDGEELLSLIAKEVPPPDLLLLDKNTPKINGFEVLKIVRANSAYDYLPIIILSSSSDPYDIDTAYSLGADGYETKPTRSEYPNTLKKIIDTPYLKRKGFVRPDVLPNLSSKKVTSQGSDWADSMDDFLETL